MPHCSKGHENPFGSRFCLNCGERLELLVGKGIYPGLLLGDRYQIARQLGQGGFGRTYLAQDINRFHELCVLKEFAPQVHGAQALQKAEELFEREAGVLYKLQHPQIPRFRELFRVNLDEKGYLFLVQDYVEGQTYHTLLEARKQQGMRFSELEVSQLLLQTLPVLEYIHSLGVIHRDISPDNLILRSSDYLPVLIDFGGVKQIAATVASQRSADRQRSGCVRKAQAQFAQPAVAATLLGKMGYAPYEQMQIGMVYPHSDLYALAVTVLVLLTGQEPHELIDDHTLTWNWRREVKLSRSLEAVLDKMLSQRIGERYQSAHQVLQVLTSNLSVSGSVSTPHQSSGEATEAHQATLAVAPAPHVGKRYSNSSQSSEWSFTPGKILLVLLLVAGGAGVGRWVANTWIQSQSSRQDKASQPTQVPTPTPSPQFSDAELNRKEQLRDRRQQLGIDYNFYVKLVNQGFWDKYPNQKGRTLSSNPDDAELREEWDKTAAQFLDQLQPLSSKARQQLGKYTAQDRVRAQVEVNKLYVSSKALYDLTDAAFFALFPRQRGKKFINQPIGQVWQALAADKLSAILAGTAFARMVFEPGASGKQVSGTLQPGEGKIYIASLAKDQIMKLDLQANPKILLSVYSPSGKTIILEDSNERVWSGTLPESGFYEFVVVSTSSEPEDYQLNLTAETTPAPSVEPSPTNTTTMESPSND